MDVVAFEEPEKFKAALPDMLDVWVAKMAESGKGEKAQELADYIRDNR